MVVLLLHLLETHYLYPVNDSERDSAINQAASSHQHWPRKSPSGAAVFVTPTLDLPLHTSCIDT